MKPRWRGGQEVKEIRAFLTLGRDPKLINEKNNIVSTTIH